MDKTFFGNQVDRLRGIYSATALNPERIDIWWKQFRHEPNHVFENALNHIIAEATTQALPAMSKIAEACGFFRTNPTGASMKVVPSAHNCEVCRDFGYRFEGDFVVKCPTCFRGREISPSDLAHAQRSYDRGAKFLSRTGLKRSTLPALPYSQSERIDREDW